VSKKKEGLPTSERPKEVIETRDNRKTQSGDREQVKTALAVTIKKENWDDET